MKLIPGFVSLAVAAWMVAGIPCLAFENASSCNECHGDFDGSISPKGTVFPSNSKHEMHRATIQMNTDCDLCHTDIGDDPFLASSAGTSNNPGLGCSGCHVGAGLRAHHAANGVTTCYTAGCHTPQESAPESVMPPYYGTADTRANNPCNDELVAKRNENWSIGDFLGLDNDGNNLYDLADLACGPYQILGITVEGNDTRITWQTAGGRTDQLGASPAVDGNFAGVGTPLAIPGVGLVTTNALDVGGAAAAAAALRVYRIELTP